MSSGDGAAQLSSKKSQKPTYSRFTQQELPACKPILTPALIIATWIFFGVTFIPIGLTHLGASDYVVQLIDRYDEVCIPTRLSNPEEARQGRIGYIQNATTDKTCIRTLIVPRDMKQPIFVYYQLEDFYQNHRRYVRSRSDEQYRWPAAAHKTGNCEPVTETEDYKPIVPCGLIAWSLFNDTYRISIRGKFLPINKTDIAWKSDKTEKFGSRVYPQNFQTQGMIGGAKLNESIPLNEQEDLLVWMRTAALPSFRKLYGRIETDLVANEILRVEIQNNYNTYAFNGKKKFVLSTTTWVGGKHDFLAKVYISVGGICLLIAIAYIIAHLIRPRPLGDPTYLSWNKNPPS